VTASAADGSAERGSSDGRRAKGERRRRAIVEATFRVLERDGPTGVSHRNIAREADVSAASIAYYFDGIDDLLVATLLESVEILVAEFGSLRESVQDEARWPRAVAEKLATMVQQLRGRTIAEFELYLLAARRPPLRPAARRWVEVAAGQVNDGRGTDAGILHALFAAVDGLLLQALVADEPPTAEHFEPALRYLLQPVEYLREIGELPEDVSGTH
jgi:DNA-binding transcriptional regulator YbjK